MTILIEPTSPPSYGVTEWPVRRFTVAEYERLVESGIIGEDEEVELIHGWLVPKMGKNPPHSASTRRTRIALESLGLSGFFVDTQEPTKLSDSVPEPDVLFLRGGAETYDYRHAVPADIVIAVEVADTSLPMDRRVKSGLYAAAGIPCYWIVNVVDLQVEAFTQPTSDGQYASMAVYTTTMELPVVIDGVEAGRINVRDLFPPPVAGAS